MREVKMAPYHISSDTPHFLAFQKSQVDLDTTNGPFIARGVLLSKTRDKSRTREENF